MPTTGSGTGVEATAAGTALSDLRDICKYHNWTDWSTLGTAACDRFINRTLQLLSILAEWPEYHHRNGRITLTTATAAEVCQTSADADITNIARIGDVIYPDNMSPLGEIEGGIDEWLRLTTLDGAATGRPTQYALRKYVDVDGATGYTLMEMLLYPTPTADEDGDFLYYPYRTNPVKLVNAGDVTDWPDYRLWLLEEALEKRIASQNRDAQGSALESNDFLQLVFRASASSRMSYKPIPLEGGFDGRERSIREIDMVGM
jgi:hypothetical protein